MKDHRDGRSLSRVVVTCCEHQCAHSKDDHSILRVETGLQLLVVHSSVKVITVRSVFQAKSGLRLATRIRSLMKGTNLQDRYQLA